MIKQLYTSLVGHLHRLTKSKSPRFGGFLWSALIFWSLEGCGSLAFAGRSPYLARSGSLVTRSKWLARCLWSLAQAGSLAPKWSLFAFGSLRMICHSFELARSYLGTFYQIFDYCTRGQYLIVLAKRLHFSSNSASLLYIRNGSRPEDNV